MEPINTESNAIEITRQPVRQAFKWLKNAFLLLKTQPWVLCMTVAWMFLTFMLLFQVPFVGGVLVAVIFPALSFGMAHTNQKVRLQEPANPLDVFSGFHPNHRTALLTVGACLAILLFILSTVLRLLDLSALTAFSEEVLKQTENIDTNALLAKFEQAMLDPAFVRATMLVNLFTFINVVILSLFSYAPLFVVWCGVEPIKAIGLSVKTIFRNILPLITVTFVLMVVGFIMSNLLILLIVFLTKVGVWLALGIVFLYIEYVFGVIFCSFHNIMIDETKQKNVRGL